jgi:hypothetical protein
MRPASIHCCDQLVEHGKDRVDAELGRTLLRQLGVDVEKAPHGKPAGLLPCLEVRGGDVPAADDPDIALHDGHPSSTVRARASQV